MKYFIIILMISIAQTCYSQTETTKPSQEEIEKWILKKLNVRGEPTEMFKTNWYNTGPYIEDGIVHINGGATEAYFNSDWIIQYGKLKVELLCKSKSKGDFYEYKLKISIPIKNIVSGWCEAETDCKCISFELYENNKTKDLQEKYTFQEKKAFFGFNSSKEVDICSRLDKAFKDLITYYPKKKETY